jgi:hypothetical protein
MSGEREKTTEEAGPARRQWSGDAGARRLFASVSRACAGGEGLPKRLEAGLGAALEMLARDPELAHLLTVEPYLGGKGDALDAQRDWIECFGDLLRDAAAADSRASRDPAFLAPFLIGGVRFQIARLVLNGEGSELQRLLPGLLEGLLGCYFEPGEPERLAPAALAEQDRPG